MSVPHERVRALNGQPVRTERAYVLYWMTSFRRVRSNFALDRAIEHARQLERPLVIFEPLRVGYEHASERLHTFILQGMAENERRTADTAVTYFPYVETKAGDGSGLLEALASQACIVVGDDWPCFFVPRMQAAAAKRLNVAFEVVDSNGLYPMHATDRVFTTAHSFRTHLQKDLPKHLAVFPTPDPLARLTLPRLKSALPVSKWPRATRQMLDATPTFLASLPIDHAVRAVARQGGSAAAEGRLELFVTRKLKEYAEARNEPEVDGTSALSPYLHFGHVSTHQVFAALVEKEKWRLDVLGKSNGGAKEGWWKLSPAAESFIDELVTWRELGFNMSSHRPDDFASLESLPPWAKQTIAEHAGDKRPKLYTLEQLERGETHDPLWNATQGQLVTEGWFHNYLRMLWGKKIYEWSPDAKEALRRMEYLMGRWSLDGRDPVSWSGYLWVLGRYDRAWGPERKIFGKLRYMSSDNTAKKISVKRFIETYG